MFFVPPSVEVREDIFPDAYHPCARNRFVDPVRLVAYPVPSDWYKRSVTPLAQLGQYGSPLTEASALPPLEAWPSRAVVESLTPEEQASFATWDPLREWHPRAPRYDLEAMEAIGWQWVRHPHGVRRQTLLDDVVRIAVPDPFTGACEAAIIRFVRKWGPLWVCRNCFPRFCCIDAFYPWKPGSDRCAWSPIEEVYVFWAFAWQVRAVLAVWDSLRRGEPVSADLYEHLPSSMWEELGADPDIAAQRRCLGDIMDLMLGYVAREGIIRLGMQWESGDKPVLKLSTGYSVWHATWLHVAQKLTGPYSIQQCDGCGGPYAREGRRPQAGRKNFCPACRGTNADGEAMHRAAKKLYARSRRQQSASSPCTGPIR
jgi:hypothetical protein